MPPTNSNALDIKRQIERSLAERFLLVFNQRMSTTYRIVELADHPDVICKEATSGKGLSLEITLLDDWEGDIAHLLRRQDKKTHSPSTGMPFISFEQDTLPRLAVRLKDKLLSNYGPETALVIGQASILWSASDWERHSTFLSSVLQGRESQFGAGIWILCNNSSTWPNEDDLFQIQTLQSGSIDEISRSSGVIARLAWEGFETRDFQVFRERVRTDLVRIDAIHGCGNTLLIAFDSNEALDDRQRAIEFYRDYSQFYCPCGQGRKS